jgi:hypothetical protein
VQLIEAEDEKMSRKLRGPFLLPFSVRGWMGGGRGTNYATSGIITFMGLAYHRADDSRLRDIRYQLFHYR